MEQERGDALAAMQLRLEKQRDEEIEVVILRLEEEAEATKAKLKKEADDRAHRAVEQVLSVCGCVAVWLCVSCVSKERVRATFSPFSITSLLLSPLCPLPFQYNIVASVSPFNIISFFGGRAGAGAGA